MSENLTKLYTTQFSAVLALKLQQSGSKLRGKVQEGFHVGKQASPIQYEGPVKMKRPEGRFSPKKRTDSDYERRWVFPIDSELDQYIDSFDKLKTIVEPMGPKATNAANAAGREWDDQLVAAATGTAYIGQDAAALSTETFDTNKFQIAANFKASAATGLTIAKLIEAKRIFRRYEVDLDSDPATLVIGSQQESDLLSQVEVVSREFNERPTLVDGKVTRFLGFDIVVMERLETFTTTTRGVLAFVKSGLYLGIWQETTNDLNKRADLSGQPWDLYTQMSSGATRLEAGRLLRIACADSTGAAITP